MELHAYLIRFYFALNSWVSICWESPYFTDEDKNVSRRQALLAVLAFTIPGSQVFQPQRFPQALAVEYVTLTYCLLLLILLLLLLVVQDWISFCWASALLSQLGATCLAIATYSGLVLIRGGDHPSLNDSSHGGSRWFGQRWADENWANSTGTEEGVV